MKTSSILIFFLILIQTIAQSQDCFNSTSPNFQKIRSCTLIVIKEDINSASYNKMLEESFNKFWKFCNYKIVNQHEVPSFLKKQGYLFHAKLRYRRSEGMEWNQFGIFGTYSKKPVEKLEYADPLAYMNVENILDISSFEYCLPNIVKAFNDFLIYAQENKFTGGMKPLYRALSPDIVRYYNSK